MNRWDLHWSILLELTQSAESKFIYIFILFFLVILFLHATSLVNHWINLNENIEISALVKKMLCLFEFLNPY